MKVTLTYKQKYELENQHDKTRDDRVRDRIKAVLLASEGWSTAMISQALRIHETTVLRHLHDYAQSEKLKPENGGSSSRLSALQTIALIEHLTEVTYYQIIAYVLAQFGVCYTVSGMNKWLHHHGFSYKKPKGVPHKFDEAKQQELSMPTRHLSRAAAKRKLFCSWMRFIPLRLPNSLMAGFVLGKTKLPTDA